MATKPKKEKTAIPARTKEETSVALKAFREDKGWSEKRLAGYVKTTVETLKKWETGETLPNPKIVKWLFRNRTAKVVETATA